MVSAGVKKTVPAPHQPGAKLVRVLLLSQVIMMTPLEARLTEENARQALEIKLLREKIDLLIWRIFGKSSEQLDDNQLMLLQGGDDGAKKRPGLQRKPRRLGG
jgi:hypothetical protein